jgi:hypothetical protein
MSEASLGIWASWIIFVGGFMVFWGSFRQAKAELAKYRDLATAADKEKIKHLWRGRLVTAEGATAAGMPRSTGARSSPRAGTSAHMAVPTREGALPRGGSVPQLRTAYLRTDRRLARVLSESVYDSTLRHPSARSLVGGDHPVATFLGRSHPGPGQILASGRPARHASAGAPSRCGPPARQGDCVPAVCAQTCGSLVRNSAEPVHMQWKCWGFRCLCGNLIATLPGRTRVARCACRARRNYPHATPQ